MTKKILPFFIMQNWLASYAKMEGLRRSFQLMARRANFKSNMEFVVDDLIDDYELYEAEFKAFFPDIAAYCQNELDVLFPGDRMSKKNQIISEKAQEFIRQQKEIARLKEEKATQAKMLKEVSKLKKSKAKVDQIASKVEELKPESAQKTEEVKKVKTKRFLLSRKDNS
jgi:hypothetical protein